jgi:hypothetical protein
MAENEQAFDDNEIVSLKASELREILKRLAFLERREAALTDLVHGQQRVNRSFTERIGYVREEAKKGVAAYYEIFPERLAQDVAVLEALEAAEENQPKRDADPEKP